MPPRLPSASPDDVVIIAAVRTPVTRARSGGMKDLLPEDMLAAALKGLIARSRVDPRLVQDIQVGSVLAPGGGATVARMAALHAGFPVSVPVSTVNRQCSSGLQAVASVAAAIRAGWIDIGIGAGVESMTANYGPAAMPAAVSDAVSSSPPESKDCLLPMGVTSENVAAEYNVSREDQDAFALASHQKASAAAQAGKFRDEIVPVGAVTADDGIRSNTSREQLAKLRPAFGGVTTAGNASQVSDGAAAVLLARRSTAAALGLGPVLATFASFAAVGVAPKVMGIGPAVAIPRALALVQLPGNSKLSLSDIDIFEINEAFASQALMVVRSLRLPEHKVNPNGGAIAIGHPLGCTGARMIATLLPELRRSKKRVGVVSMCIGTGMGAAAVIIAE